MSEVLTMAEIERLYDGEWVLLADPEYSEDIVEVINARVLAHDQSVRVVEEIALAIGPVSSEILFVGEPANDTVYLLRCG